MTPTEVSEFSFSVRKGYPYGSTPSFWHNGYAEIFGFWKSHEGIIDKGIDKMAKSGSDEDICWIMASRLYSRPA